MKKNVLLLIVVAVMALGATAQEAKRVLFIGNSYTDVNNLPMLVQKVSGSVGERIDYESNTPGGCTFQQHCSNQSMTLIQQGGWDVVVLQEQSQLPSFPWSQVSRECLPWAAQLAAAVYASNPDGEAMYYMTWGRKNGDQGNAIYFDSLGTYEGMDDLLYERYMYMGRENDASVCPVGRVWRHLRSTYHDAIELYSNDESHPSIAGSYAAACAFHTMIFHRSPLDVTYVPEGLNERDAETIRGVVDTVVWQNLSFWLRQRDTTHQDTTQHDTTQGDTTHVGMRLAETAFPIHLYPNPAKSMVTIRVSEPSRDCEAIIYDLKGRKLRSIQLQGGAGILDIADLPRGIYTVTVTSANRLGVTRIVKN